MIVEILTLIGIFLSYVLSIRFQNKKKVFLIMSGICIVLIMGSRYFISGFTDESTYNYLYQRYTQIDFQEFRRLQGGKIEFGFYFLYWCLARLFTWPQFGVYFITAICVVSFFRYIYRNSDDPFFAVMIFLAFDVFSFYMAAYRQCFAMCLCLFALEYAQKKKFWKYILLCLLAFFMHKSALVFLPVYFLMQLKPNMQGKLANVAIVMTVGIGGPTLLAFASQLFARDDYLQVINSSMLGYSIQIIIMLIPFVMDLLRSCDWSDEERIQQFRNKVLLSLGLTFYILKKFYWPLERTSYFYSFAVISALSNCIYHFGFSMNDKKLRSVIRALAIVIFIVLFLWRQSPRHLIFFWEH